MTTEDSYEIVQHNIEVSKMAEAFAHFLDMPEEKCKMIAVAGVFIDLGKIAMDFSVFQQKRILTFDEFEYVKQHASKSTEILIQSNLISREILSCIIHHHENYDGTGYPSKLREGAIPEGAMILKICDVYKALTEKRPYRTSYSHKEALVIMLGEKYKYNPALIDAFEQFIELKG